ncbi:DUF4129 domain-containing protein [Halocalculus aciditolerans]|uniref:Protein-glutamine gamma-glutamyltransferase-like C-terminal domain-containing protein n=1 Tax=Halocalculus aciditolerans TaxID=1383812 RepID=A0A830FEB9_9EURY|nr:DUF4129 domain-containing protein [Halocalculus aciditolerans]GGL66687.1 hypothetical protein GCM10009039_25810 [Halocalculus aciditolerans]
MNRSHLAALLITVFALAVLGAAAGTLHSAHPTRSHSPGTPGSPGTGGPAGASPNPANPSGGQSSSHYFLPQLNFSSEATTGLTHATSGLVRLAIAVLLLLVSGGLSLWWLTGDDGAAAVEPTTTPTDHSVSEITRSRPPDAAHAPADNDVYRAWQAMLAIAHPDDHRHKTPSELAHAAVDAGLPESAVRTVTRLFRTVRYGDAPPTPDRERDAQHALHTIQRADGEGETDDESEPASE